MRNLDGRLLLLEDDEVDAELILHRLDGIQHSSLDVEWVRSLEQALDALDERQTNVVLADLTLPDARGVEIVRALTGACPDDCSIIVQTGLEGEDLALEALELGAQDYLHKSDIDSALLERSIRYALARNRIRAQLTRSESERRQSASELEDFAHIVAHDLRAPVRTARLFADRLLERLGEGDELALDYGLRLERSLHRVDDMIVSTLDYASLRGGAQRATVVDIGGCIEQARALLRADLEDVGGQIRIEAERGLSTRACSDQLLRVFLNILGNSIKYRRDDVPLEIEVFASGDEQTLTIDLVDNGVGVPVEEHERAFRLLERLEPGRADGLGFGLPIARRIIEGLGGNIAFQPCTTGADVRILLPRATAAKD